MSFNNTKTDIGTMDLLEKENVGYCGIICANCPAYKATIADDDEARRKIAEEWTKKFDHEFKTQEINCKGCREKGPHIAYCSTCDIRICAEKKGINICAYCIDYPCEKLKFILEKVPEAKEYLDKLNKGL